MDFPSTPEFARESDEKDQLIRYKKQFYFPKLGGNDCLYFSGNSLGLQPKNTTLYVGKELKAWQDNAVSGHHIGKNPWLYYHKIFRRPLSRLTGAFEHEVVAMNNLTTNLHLLMVSFYRPTYGRFKILIEKGAFPSDLYVVESQANFHGFDPEETIIELEPRQDEYVLRTSDILEKIDQHKNELALILLGGVNYYTGQLFNMKTLTEAGHKAGAVVGFDLAHAIGNVKLELNSWNVDFAVWCSYKYLNSGPGGVAGAFIHERYANQFTIKRFAGWWGHVEEERFKMEKGFKPIYGAEGWQLGNAPILLMAAHKASLDMFEEAGIDRLVEKSSVLTSYLEFLLNNVRKQKSIFKIITPSDVNERGAQLSLLFDCDCDAIYTRLLDKGVIVDMRRPDVIRVAPVPFYNSFEDVYKFYEIFKSICLSI